MTFRVSFHVLLSCVLLGAHALQMQSYPYWCRTVHVGPSLNDNMVTSSPDDGGGLPDESLLCPTVVDKWNWIGDFGAIGDTFSVTQVGQQVTIKRIDADLGWGMDLKFQCCANCLVAHVGSSPHSRQKGLTISSSDVVCPARVDKLNWLPQDRFPDWFNIMQEGTQVSVTRGDANAGWGMDLSFLCCRKTLSPTPSPTLVPTAAPPTPTPTQRPRPDSCPAGCSGCKKAECEVGCPWCFPCPAWCLTAAANARLGQWCGWKACSGCGGCLRWTGTLEFSTTADDPYESLSAVDSLGNTYVLDPMRQITKISYDGYKDFTKVFCDKNDRRGCVPRAMCVGKDDSLYVVNEYTTPSRVLGTQVFILDAFGNKLGELAKIDNLLSNHCLATATGEIFIAGYTPNNRALDGQVNRGGSDLLVVKINLAGDREWTSQLGTTKNDYARQLVMDSSGNLLVSVSHNNLKELYVMKYDTAGNMLWRRRVSMESTRMLEFLGIAIDHADNLLAFTVGSSPLSADLRKYDSSGEQVWINPVTNLEVEIDTISPSFITAFYDGSSLLAFDDKHNKRNVVKFDGSGALEWTSVVNHSNETDRVVSVKVDKYDDAILIRGVADDCDEYDYCESNTVLLQRIKPSTGTIDEGYKLLN